MEAKIFQPSADPSSFSLDRSGWGIIPSTFLFAFRMPAMLLNEPLGLASGGDFSRRRGVAESDPVLGFQREQLIRGAKVIAFHVPDRNLQHLALGQAGW